MKKNDVFTFTAPNGVEVTGVCLEAISTVVEKGLGDPMTIKHLCYAQNRLFTHYTKYVVEPVAIDTDEFGDDIFDYQPVEIKAHYGEVLVDYAVLPDYDELLARYNDLEVAQAETQSGM